jgi:opacity protein-like surface antigen
MINKLLLSSLLILTLSEAKDSFSSERLLGIEVGYAGVDTKDAIGLNESVSNVEFGFRIGAQNKDWRTSIIANMSNSKGHKIQKAMISFDKFVWQSLYKKDDIVFKPYLSGHIGYLKHIADGNTNSGIDEKGMLYGGGLGLVWNVLDEVDFDLGYRYSITELSELDSFDAVTLGVNYIY